MPETFLERLRAALEAAKPHGVHSPASASALLGLILNNAAKIERLIEAAELVDRCQWEQDGMEHCNENTAEKCWVCDLQAALAALDEGD